jgi:hypothetical protein
VNFSARDLVVYVSRRGVQATDRLSLMTPLLKRLSESRILLRSHGEGLGQLSGPLEVLPAHGQRCQLGFPTRFSSRRPTPDQIA